jgi:hypothetical protein
MIYITKVSIRYAYCRKPGGIKHTAVNMYLRVYKLILWQSPLEANIYFVGHEIPLSCSQAVISTGPFA